MNQTSWGKTTAQWIFAGLAAAGGAIVGSLLGFFLAALSVGLENRPPTELVALLGGGCTATLSVLLGGKLAPTQQRTTALVIIAILLTAAIMLRLLTPAMGSWVMVAGMAAGSLYAMSKIRDE